MDCTRFEDLLFESLDADLLDTEDQSMQAHASSCARCREFAALMRAEAADGSSEIPVDLVAGVLERTSGGACERAQLLLADRADGALGADGSLLSMHLGGCADCAAVARALVHLQHELPTLAELDPGAGFVAAVMAATVGRAAPAPARIPLRVRIEEMWERLSQRPRLAFEGAFVGSLAFILVLGLPAAGVAELPSRLMAEVRQERLEVQSTVAENLGRAADAGLSVWATSTARLGEIVSVRPDPAGTRSRLADMFGRWRQASVEIAAHLWDGEFSAAFARIWRLWTQPWRGDGNEEGSAGVGNQNATPGHMGSIQEG